MARCKHSGKRLSLAGLHLHHVVPRERQRRPQLFRIGGYAERFLHGAVHAGENLVHAAALRPSGLCEFFCFCDILRIQKRSPCNLFRQRYLPDVDI